MATATATTKARRTLLTRKTILTKKKDETDELAQRLETNLKISEPLATTKPRRPVATTSTLRTKIPKPITANEAGATEKKVKDAMGAVNTVLQHLTTAIGCKWTATSAKKDGDVDAVATTAALAASARSALMTIRKSGSVAARLDVERAALGLLGKLVQTEMYNEAMEIALDMRNPLSTLIGSQDDSTSTCHASASSPDPLLLLALPLPENGRTLEEPLQTVMLNYLQHTFVIAVKIMATGPTKHGPLLDGLFKVGSLVSWLPHLQEIQRKTLDSALKRTYVTLANSFTMPPTSSSTLLSFRFAALRFLLLTSDATPCSFWEQCLKFGVSYVKTNSAAGVVEKETVGDLLVEFKGIVAAVDEQGKGELKKEKRWLDFCEYWISLAKRGRDRRLLNEVTVLIHASSEANRSPGTIRDDESGDREDSSTPVRSSARTDTFEIDVSKACSTFTQSVALLEALGAEEAVGVDELHRSLEASIVAHRKCWMLFSADSPSLKSSRSKLQRGSENLRRACLKVLEQSRSDCAPVVRMLESILDDHELASQTLSTHGDEITDFIIASLDTLFNLSSATLSPQNPTSCELAYSYLSKAISVVDSAAQNPSDKHHERVLIANFTRCVSGAFFNAAGALYKAGKYGHAVRFLNDAAPLAVKALRQYDESISSAECIDQQGNEKDVEVWKAHRLQLFKRYELLAACQSKLGNRKLAFDAFVQGVTNYRYDDAFLAVVRRDAANEIFQEHPQLAAMVDRLTYMGAAELFLDCNTSLLRPLQAKAIHPLVIGAVIERQKRSLEESKWKPKIQGVVHCLLNDLLVLYEDAFPLRRARVLIWKLEAAYLSHDQAVSVDVVAQDALESLAKEDFRGDVSLAHSCVQYRATVHLWLALHAHRSSTTENTVTILIHTDDAHRALAQMGTSPLKDNIARGSSKRVSGCVSSVPKTRRVARPSQRKRNIITDVPVTPKSRRESLGFSDRSSFPDVANRSGLSANILNDAKTLLALAYTVTQVLGLLGQTIAKVRLLHVLRRICGRDKCENSEEYLKFSIELAHELARLGKFERACSLFSSLGTKEHAVLAINKVMLDLRFAEALAVSGNTAKSISLYEEAQQLFATISFGDTLTSTSLRIRYHAQSLEVTAAAYVVFAYIQLAQSNMVQAIGALLQAFRVLNRAIESLSRLHRTVTNIQGDDTDPFSVSDLKEALPANGTPTSGLIKDVSTAWKSLDGLEWRIGDALLHTMFSISRLYFKRGFAREAEYFAQQAQDFARSLKAPTMVSRALAYKGEVQILLGRVQDAQETLSSAAALVQDLIGADAAQTRRLQGDTYLMAELTADAQAMYIEAMRILGDTGSALANVDLAERKSFGSPITPRTQQKKSLVAPVLMASILRQHVWLLRDDNGDDYDKHLNRLLALPQLQEIQAESNFLLGRLALHSIFQRFRQDMFLSSLAESTLAIPMSVAVESKTSAYPVGDIAGALEHAERLHSSGLETFREHGTVTHLRGAATSLALIKIFQSSLGRSTKKVPAIVGNLLDFSSSVTLTRELLESIHHKLQDVRTQRDAWPSLSRQTEAPRTRSLLDALSNSLDDEPEDLIGVAPSMRQYWEAVLARHSSRTFNLQSNPALAGLESLPEKWTIVNIGITEDKRTLLISRQRPKRDPLVFCIPLKGRRENDDDEQFTHEDAVGELNDIIQSSDESTRLAVHIKPDDKEGKSSWWVERKRLDKRLKELLANIEFCWLGAFKTILSQPMNIPPDVIASFRSRLEKVFRSMLGKNEKKHKGKLKLDTSFLECLACLQPSCKDEELEDLIYFVLDLYHFHGVPIALAEVDVDVVIVDLRTALEEHNARARGHLLPERDAHIFLVLDKNVQGIPWESLPILRGCSVSRIPNAAFLLDRIDLARVQRGESLQQPLDVKTTIIERDVPDRIKIDPSKGFFMLNPGGDLRGTEDRFTQWAKHMKNAGWDGITGMQPSEQQLLNALARKDIVVYFGHGGAEQYIRSHKIRHLQRCAATMLWGCSSGALRDMGEFDRVGTPYTYMLAGCPTLVANLWDVTDRDIDKFALSVFDKLHLHGESIRQWRDGGPLEEEKVSVVSAVAQSRDVCKLKYLTGAAPVVYGIPFYL